MWLSNSSVGRKVVMSVTGIALVLFLTFHMAMNLVAIISADGYNMVCEFLGANWYALAATVGPVSYTHLEEVKKMNEPLQGNFEGIGVQFQMIEDTLLVVQPVSNGPSEKIGILAGDRIIAVNDLSLIHI